MKKILLTFFMFSSFISLAQRFKEVVLWQVETASEGLVFGISEDKQSATHTISSFKNRNMDNKYDISESKPIFKYTTFPIENREENPVDDFITLTKGKAYKVFSEDDLLSVEIAKEEGINSAINYYTEKRNGAGREFVTERIWNMVFKYDKFRIKDSERYVLN